MKLFAKQHKNQLCAIVGIMVATTILEMNAHAKEPTSFTAGWKTECIGRYQISLPGDVEIAVRSLGYFSKGEVPGIVFADGSDAEWRSGFSFSGGGLGVSAKVPLSEFLKYKTFLLKNKDVSIQILSSSKSDVIKREWPKKPGTMHAKGADAAFLRTIEFTSMRCMTMSK